MRRNGEDTVADTVHMRLTFDSHQNEVNQKWNITYLLGPGESGGGILPLFFKSDIKFGLEFEFDYRSNLGTFKSGWGVSCISSAI